MQQIWNPTGREPPAQVSLRETLAEASAAPAPTAEAAPPLGRGMDALIENYRAITRARAIFYPVAYRFVRELGRGRQGIVFLGMRHGARSCLTRHAIKLFDPSIYGTSRQYWTDMGRIADQISRLQSVHAPNLVGRDIYDEENGIGYVQMEAIDGIDIHKFIYGRHFDIAKARSKADEWARFADVIFRFEEGKIRVQPGVALYIMRSVLRGIDALHDAGFVHCDIKPANIMCDAIGNIKLVDYGRATLVEEKISMLLGSPLYMAPEIHRRERYLAASDIYSLGLVGLELLRGEALVDYSAMNESQLLQYKMDLPRRLPDLLPSHVRRNKDFVQILMKLLDPDPAKRFQQADQADSGSMGLALLHKQLTMAGKDSEYYRDLESYMAKLRPAERDGPAGWEGLLV